MGGTEDSVLIRLQGVTKKFKNKAVLNSISLDVHAGEILGIIGLSGAGKTTLLRMLIGFINCDEGALLYRFKPLVKEGSSAAFDSFIKKATIHNKLFGFATQDSSFYPELTVEENLVYFANLYDIPEGETRGQLESLLELLELRGVKGVLARELSEGMQKRLDIACALVHKPKILFLDEPTANLDPLMRKQILGLVKEINDTGVTIVISSHFLEELEDICNRIILLHNKSIIATGTVNDIRKLVPPKEEIFLRSLPGKYDTLIEVLKKELKAKTKKPAEKTLLNIAHSNRGVMISTKSAAFLLPFLKNALTKSNESLSELNVKKISLKEILESIVF